MYATLGPNWRVPLRNSPRSRSYVYRYSELVEQEVRPGITINVLDSLTPSVDEKLLSPAVMLWAKCKVTPAYTVVGC